LQGVIVRQYYLHRRNRTFYVQFVEPETKRRLAALSTGKTNRDDALIVVAGWLRDGIPQRQITRKPPPEPRPVNTLFEVKEIFKALKTADITQEDVRKIEKILQERELVETIIVKGSKSSEPFVEYLRRFWNYQESPYFAEKRSHGTKLGIAYANMSLGKVNLYWAPYFQDQKIGEITLQNLKEFSTALGQNYPNLSVATLYQIMLVGVTALRWAFANTYIPYDPTRGLSGYAFNPKKRGVLSPQEAAALFSLNWKDKRHMILNLVAMTTGLRIAEILALKKEQVGEKYLFVENSFSQTEGLKSTKTEENRSVPIMPVLRDALLKLANFNPHGDGYIFWGAKKNRPYSQHFALKYLRKMLVQLRAGEKPNPEQQAEAEKYWKKRNVVFHSWRHFYASRMTDKLEARKVMLATGHKTESIFKVYADHALESDLSDVAMITGEVFGDLIPEIAILEGPETLSLPNLKAQKPDLRGGQNKGG
jgi:integrase